MSEVAREVGAVACSTPISVMLVDDQELIRTGFRLVLRSDTEISVIAEAEDGADALQQLQALSDVQRVCDVVVMDIRMPRMNGIDACREICQRFPDTRVLVLTTFDLDEYVVAAIHAGASGFLVKDAKPSELTHAIRRIAAGDAAMAPSVTARMITHMRNGTTGDFGARGFAHAARAEAPSAAREALLRLLTEREREVLMLIAQGKNNTEIGTLLYLSESTVKTHVGRVLSKLQLRDRVHAVIFAYECGIIEQ